VSCSPLCVKFDHKSLLRTSETAALPSRPAVPGYTQKQPVLTAVSFVAFAHRYTTLSHSISGSFLYFHSSPWRSIQTCRIPNNQVDHIRLQETLAISASLNILRRQLNTLPHRERRMIARELIISAYRCRIMSLSQQYLRTILNMLRRTVTLRIQEHTGRSRIIQASSQPMVRGLIRATTVGEDHNIWLSLNLPQDKEPR
jgi:hypothetical protein